jgi:hypothetical protein
MKTNRTKQQLWLQVMMVAVAMTAGWCWFAFGVPYTLYTKEQLVLFVADWAAVAEYLGRPAILSSIVGDYLTQFYLLIGGAATILSLFMLLLWWGTRTALKRFGAGTLSATACALLPVAAEVALNCYVEYPLSMTIAAVIAVWSFVAWTKMREGASKYIIAALSIVALYWLVGAHTAIFVLGCVAWAWKEGRRVWSVVMPAVAAGAVALWGELLYLPLSQSFCYPLIENYMLQHCSVFLITEAAFVVALVGARGRAWLGALVATLMAVVGVAMITDRTQEYWLGMSCEAYFNRFDRVLERAEANWEYQSYVASYYTNLALAQRNELGEHLTEYYQPSTYGLMLDVDEGAGYCYAIAAADATAAIGDMAEAQRATLLAMTFTPQQRSSRVAKKIVEIAMVVGDRELAEKFLWQLERTAMHKTWAAKRREVLATGSAALDVDRAKLVSGDGFVGANDWYPALYALVEANGANRMAVEYLLSMHLLRKDRERFVADYERYFYPYWGAMPPKIYQQALMMAFDSESELVAAINRYHISPEVQRECIEYSRIYVAEQGHGEALQERFGRTYWFYCNYAQMK